MNEYNQMPFSVFNAKGGEWQRRKRYWKEKGIHSWLGRGDTLPGRRGLSEMIGTKEPLGTSVFDPVLCELMYNWYCPDDGLILDPFSGGSVRGLMASFLGKDYIGVDIRKEQIEENIKQYHGLKIKEGFKNLCKWYTADSIHIDKVCQGVKADLLFSCPPYVNIEHYSDLKEDLGNLPYEKFLPKYKEIIKKSCALLKDDRFAIFVVGEARDKYGRFHCFVPDTIKCFVDCGLKYYNEGILLDPIGSSFIKAKRPFNSSRKLTKIHQNMLIFIKGDEHKATMELDKESYQGSPYNKSIDWISVF